MLTTILSIILIMDKDLYYWLSDMYFDVRDKKQMRRVKRYMKEHQSDVDWFNNVHARNSRLAFDHQEEITTYF